jgi:Ferritin-like domain
VRGEAGRVRRRAFLTGLGALAVAGCGAGSSAKKTATATVPAAVKPGLPGAPDDDATLSYLVRIEHMQSDLYRVATETGFFKGRDLDTIKSFGEAEDQHVADLEATLRQRKVKPPARPQANFPLVHPDSILDIAVRIENLVAAAYLGQLGRIADRNLLGTLMTVHTVEARHAATLNLMRHKSVTPTGAFARPENMATVLRILDVYTA